MDWILTSLFFIIAFLYAGVGFGGGSSYLALLRIMGWPFETLRIVALLCNITVVSGNTLNYHRFRLIPWRKTLPIVLVSVPLAYMGGLVRFSTHTFDLVLGLALLLAGLLLLIKTFIGFREIESVGYKPYVAPIIGGAIGFLSGCVGIGGGIFLAPVLHFLRFDKPKAIAAIASFFILVNSIAGLAGQFYSYSHVNLSVMQVVPLLLAVLLGGQLGNLLVIRKVNPKWVRAVTALLIIFVGVRILIT